ncbi:MAG: hypothetical protein GY830_03645 [Bacteroidetes bacterium]|nr:hypothetical protein [Bacteroidota bacterium]
MIIINKISKYLFFIIFSMTNQIINKKHLLIRIFMYSIIILIYYNIFKKVSKDPNRLLYITITQWITASVSIVLFYIKNDIETNRIIYYFLKPTSYILYRFFDSLGETFIKVIFIGFCCIGQIYLLTNNFPFALSDILNCFFLVFIGALLFNTILIFLGLLSFWIKSINNLIYLNLTCVFCFGGLIMPLNYYPEYLRKIAYFTPYPWILNWPADIITDNKVYKFGLLYWFLWIIFFLIINTMLFKKIQNSN